MDMKCTINIIAIIFFIVSLLNAEDITFSSKLDSSNWIGEKIIGIWEGEYEGRKIRIGLDELELEYTHEINVSEDILHERLEGYYYHPCDSTDTTWYNLECGELVICMFHFRDSTFYDHSYEFPVWGTGKMFKVVSFTKDTILLDIGKQLIRADVQLHDTLDLKYCKSDYFADPVIKTYRTEIKYDTTDDSEAYYVKKYRKNRSSGELIVYESGIPNLNKVNKALRSISKAEIFENTMINPSAMMHDEMTIKHSNERFLVICNSYLVQHRHMVYEYEYFVIDKEEGKFVEPMEWFGQEYGTGDAGYLLDNILSSVKDTAAFEFDIVMVNVGDEIDLEKNEFSFGKERKMYLYPNENGFVFLMSKPENNNDDNLVEVFVPYKYLKVYLTEESKEILKFK